MSLQLSNINNEKEEIIDPENLIKEGIDIICHSFNTNIENYTGKIKEQKKIIEDLNKKIGLLKQEIEMIQRENQYYKTQNKKLKKEVENMNKVVNNIKGKLINFDFNINTKQIVENMNYDKNANKNNKKLKTNHFSIFNNIRNDIIKDNNNNNSIYDIKNFFKERNIKNKELSRNSQTIRYEIKNSKINDIIFDSDINSINNDDILSEINLDENKINNYNDEQKRQLHLLYSDLNILKKNKSKYKNYNEENSKNNFYRNNRNSFEHPLINKKNINFNSYKNINTYRRKNKIRNNSINTHIKKEKINNDIKYLIKNNNEIIKEKEHIDLNLEPFSEYPDDLEYYNKICKTFQNNKNINNINCIKELKLKEINFFMEKCKDYLEKEIFENISILYKRYKEDIIKDKDIIKKIQFYLKYDDILLNSFNNINSK